MRLTTPAQTLILDAEPAENFMRFRITGECNARDLKLMVPVILEETVKHGFDRAFVDTSSMIGELADFDRHHLAEILLKHWGLRRRIGIRCTTEKYAGSRFFETVAVNRSGQVRVTDRTDELLAWLSAD